jgi:hypothetical protein
MKTTADSRRTFAYSHRGSPASWLDFVFASFLLLLPVNLPAQGVATGTIYGSVSDTATGKYLEGAEVMVQGTALHTSTDREGRFTLMDVPVGARNVAVSYPGMDYGLVPVDVATGQAADIAVKLTSEVVVLSAFKVTTAKEGMVQAVALQKISMNMKVVAAGDQYGDIAEGNAAEYLKFLPGVGVDYNANDARAVALRGMNTAFANVTMDGIRSPAPPPAISIAGSNSSKSPSTTSRPSRCTRHSRPKCPAPAPAARSTWSRKARSTAPATCSTTASTSRATTPIFIWGKPRVGARNGPERFFRAST